MDWDAFETAWYDTGCRALAELAAANPAERLYAAAFHLCYLDGVEILPPALAANAESAVHERYGYSTRFVPAEWRWDALAAASEAMRPWYRRLGAEFLTPPAADRTAPPPGAEQDAPPPGADRDAAVSGTERDVALARLEAAHDAALARVCRAITATAAGGGIHAALPPTFVAVILEGEREDEEADLIRASVDPRTLAAAPGLAEYLSELDAG